ncbi:glycosyl hydrolase family 71-domain-containing protein [Abortiporus biennis]|nr:glycosyl hydrolase family 71-domain-containing protein [Abortiporus biennis]
MLSCHDALSTLLWLSLFSKHLPRSDATLQLNDAIIVIESALGTLFGPPNSTLNIPTTNSPNTISTPNGSGFINGSNSASSELSNLVFAHHIVGNTYNYTQDSWASDIKLASSKGIDAFALNVGSDSWEAGQIKNAYSAAQSLNTTFKLFLSLDMSSLPCSQSSDAGALRDYITTYASHPNQLLYNGSVFVSTFAGESCTFGFSSNSGTILDDSWRYAIKNTTITNFPPVYFVPSFFIDPTRYRQLTVIDGAFNWNSAWPTGNTNATTTSISDISYTSNLRYNNQTNNRTYMAGVSPWFFTHYGKDTFNKNFIYHFDDWLFAQRWELLIANRTNIDFAEVITWNDYGESHYVGPIDGVQPMSQSWVNGFDHQGWLDLMQYYITAYKTGTYPPITKDRVFLWSRLHPVNATASNDTVGKPTNYEWTEDYLWAVVLLTSSAEVTLSCSPSSSSQKITLPAGLNKLKLPLTTGTGANGTCNVKATISRSQNITLDFEPEGFTFSAKPITYNFNVFVAASPA